MLTVMAAAPEASQDAGAPVKDNSPQNFKIAGIVVDAITGEALARVRVTLATVPPQPQRLEMITGEGGHFEFAALPAGKYSLRGARAAYVAANYDEHEQFSTAIVTGVQFATEKLVLRLMPTATIAGRVLDEAGEPVRDARVQLFLEDHGQGTTRVLGNGRATTDDRGYFDFGHLRPGSYFVAATAKPWYAVYPQSEGGAEVSPALDVAYPTTFSGGVTDPEGAEAIVLKGGERRDVEIRLTPVSALRLKFQGQANGRFRMPVLRKLLFDSFPVEAQIGEVRSVGPGQFELVGVPAGRYEVATGSAEESGQVVSEMNLTRGGVDLSEVRGETLGKLTVTLKPMEGEALPAQYGVALRNARQRVMAYREGDASGKVAFDGLKPDKYGIVITVQGTPGKRYAVTRTVSASGAVSPGHEVGVVSGAALDLTAEVTVGEVRIAGVVKKTGQPAAGMMVALVPQDPEAHVDLFRRDQTDFDGSFVLPGVIPGTYTIVAVEDAWGFEWLKAGVLARYVQHGQKVIIGEKMRGTLHLPEAVEVQAR